MILVVEPEFVIVTAYVTSQFVKHAISEGANQVFEKPLQKQTLEQITDYCQKKIKLNKQKTEFLLQSKLISKNESKQKQSQGSRQKEEEKESSQDLESLLDSSFNGKVEVVTNRSFDDKLEL